VNVFDLPGPEFLVFYIALAAVAGIGLHLYLYFSEDGSRLGPPLGDPFRIACLRGGPTEAARVAVLSLVDRSLLQLQGSELAAAQGSAPPAGLHPIERAVFDQCSRFPVGAGQAIQSPEVETACAETCEALVRMGLVPSRAANARRRNLFVLAAALVLGIGAIKIAVALGRGYSNIGFLIMLMIAAVFFFVWLGRPRRRTRAGARMLADLNRLLAPRRMRGLDLRPGATTGEAMLLAAMFGIAALPSVAGFAELQQVYAPPRLSSSGSGGSCGSSDGGCGGGSGCGGCGSG
jgi:uncharacterized protein (TIGR04222 family)